MTVLRISPNGAAPAGDTLQPIIQSLSAKRDWLAGIPVGRILALFDDFAARLPRDSRTATLDGVAFLSAWLKRRNLESLLETNLNGNPAYLDGFVARGRDYLAAAPHGLAAMWLAGNVPTLPLFSLVPALLAKNVCLAKLASADPSGMDRLLAVLAESEAEGLRGTELLDAAAVVWFDYRDRALNQEMSLAADVRIVWGGAEAVNAISSMPRREHCTEIIFGPKYSIGLIGRKVAADPVALDAAATAFVRDVAAFEQRACSAPQTIFVERADDDTLSQTGGLFAKHLAKLPPKKNLDAYTTMKIVEARARWTLDESKSVIASAGSTDWTVCIDRDVSLKEAVQSRTVFLTEIDSWRQILPLLTPKIQTIGTALGDLDESLAFATLACRAGVARCVRPGIMNNYESPWDGKLLINQLVRWVSLKP